MDYLVALGALSRDSTRANELFKYRSVTEMLIGIASLIALIIAILQMSAQ